MRDLTREEVVAMWLWGAEYAASGLSAIEWHSRLDASRHALILDFINQYERAHDSERTLGDSASPEGGSE